MISGGHGQEQSHSRYLSKEISKSESSFRVLYYGGTSGTVPFLWESQPGTPKHKFADTSLPPLTPPPSYQFSTKSNSIQRNPNPNSKPRFLYTILKMGMKNSHVSPSFSSSSSSGSSAYSVTSVLDIRSRVRSRLRSRSMGQFDVDGDEEQGRNGGTPKMVLCFGSVRDDGSGRVYGGKGMKNVKKTLWGILGHGKS